MNDIYDHAPECDVAIWLERAIETDAPRWLGVPDDVACQCQKLRACEQRVTEDLPAVFFGHGDEKTVLQIRDMGYAAGVQAARDAVAAKSAGSPWPNSSYNDGLIDALAAIDALRGER